MVSKAFNQDSKLKAQKKQSPKLKFKIDIA